MKKIVYIMIGVILGTSIYACAMGGRSSRLTTDIDDSEIYYYLCTDKMVPNPEGKVCLVECKNRLKKNGKCDKKGYKYRAFDLKKNHRKFMNTHLLVPKNLIF